MEVVLTITFDPDANSIKVDGPINNKMVAYGMLEQAKDAIRKLHEAAADQSRIVPAQIGARLNINGG